MRISLSMLRQIIREEIEGQLSLNEMGRARKINPGDKLFDFKNMDRGSAKDAPGNIEMINLPGVIAPRASTAPAAPLRKDFIWTRTGETVRALSQGIAREIFEKMANERNADEFKSSIGSNYVFNKGFKKIEIPLEEVMSLEEFLRGT